MMDALGKRLRTAGARVSNLRCQVFSRPKAWRRCRACGSSSSSASAISCSNSSAVEARRTSGAMGATSGIGTDTRGLPAARISKALTGLVASVSGRRLKGRMRDVHPGEPGRDLRIRLLPGKLHVGELREAARVGRVGRAHEDEVPVGPPLGQVGDEVGVEPVGDRAVVADDGPRVDLPADLRRSARRRRRWAGAGRCRWLPSRRVPGASRTRRRGPRRRGGPSPCPPSRGGSSKIPNGRPCSRRRPASRAPRAPSSRAATRRAARRRAPSLRARGRGASDRAPKTGRRARRRPGSPCRRCGPAPAARPRRRSRASSGSRRAARPVGTPAPRRRPGARPRRSAPSAAAAAGSGSPSR